MSTTCSGKSDTPDGIDSFRQKIVTTTMMAALLVVSTTARAQTTPTNNLSIVPPITYEVPRDWEMQIVTDHILEQGNVLPESPIPIFEEEEEEYDDSIREARRQWGFRQWKYDGSSRSKPDTSRLPQQPMKGPIPPSPTDTQPSFMGRQPRQPAEATDSGEKTPPAPDGEELDNVEEEEAATAEVERVIVSRHSLASSLEPQPVESLPPMTSQLDSLRTKLRRVLKAYYRRPLNTRDNDPWEVMHQMLGFGIHSTVQQGGTKGRMITAVGWLCYNKPCKFMRLLYATPSGELRAKHGVGLQGHYGQFLSMLAQCRVSNDYEIRVGKRTFTVDDLIQAEMKTCYSKSELTFKLIALMHYLESDETWVNDQGIAWDIPRLIREEMAQPIRGAACGGTHRLAGLSLAVRTRVRRGEPLDGQYAKAAEFVEKYEDYAFRLQNRDGSLSTQWFRGRGAESDVGRRVKTTGHILEWLIYSLDEEELFDQRTVRAVTYLTNMLYSNYNYDWEVGPVCHALHSLVLYDERVFKPYDQQELAAKRSRSRTTQRIHPGTMR